MDHGAHGDAHAFCAHECRCWGETECKIACGAGVWSRRSAQVCMPGSGVWGGTNLCQREKNLDVFIQAQKLLQIWHLKSTVFFLLRFPSTSQSPSYSQPETLPDAMIAVEKQLITGVAGDAQTNICARHTEPGDWNTLSPRWEEERGRRILPFAE